MPPDDLDLLAEPFIDTPENRRIAAALRDLAGVMPGFLAPETHAGECWRVHVGCLAARIRRTLTGEDYPDAR